MAQTVIEKILGQKTAQPTLSPDDRVWIDLDLVTMRDFGGPNAIIKYNQEFSAPVFDPEKIAITFDVQVPAKLEANARNQKICRDFAREQGISKLFDVNQGIGQHVLFEHGLIRPGLTVSGTDSHMNLLGAFGCYATGVGTTDVVGALRTGKIWIRIPQTNQILFHGQLTHPTTAKDVILSVIKEIGEAGGINHAFEFSGPYAQQCNVHEAITLSSMITEMSGHIGFFHNNRTIEQELSQRVGETISLISPDQDASYDQQMEFDLDSLTPQVACPHSPANVKPVEEVAGVPLDQVFIGSCTNGRFEDFEQAARILKGQQVDPNTRLIIVPATTEVTKKLVHAGLFEIFLDAGAVMCNAGCSLCTSGHCGVLSQNETSLSTGNRNFVGKIGKGASVYLSSPIIAAYSAITGVISGPP